MSTLARALIAIALTLTLAACAAAPPPPVVMTPPPAKRLDAKSQLEMSH
jgi:hypothetical protein